MNKHDYFTQSNAQDTQSPSAGCVSKSSHLQTLEEEQRRLITRLARNSEMIFRLKQNPKLAEELDFFLY